VPDGYVDSGTCIAVCHVQDHVNPNMEGRKTPLFIYTKEMRNFALFFHPSSGCHLEFTVINKDFLCVCGGFVDGDDQFLLINLFDLFISLLLLVQTR
jgi:hypothetical protein